MWHFGTFTGLILILTSPEESVKVGARWGRSVSSVCVRGDLTYEDGKVCDEPASRERVGQ